MKFLFLYTEIAEYFLACCKELSKHGEVHIVRWPVNKEAPFKFAEVDSIKLYSKSDYNVEGLKALVNEINPTVIICSGWVDKDYLKITKLYFKKIPTVMTCDTHWRGDVKQYIAAFISRFTLMRIFSDAWVPGEIQKEYAIKLGFKTNNIQKGFYSCDLPYFQHVYETQKTEKQKQFPKRFLFVGRYYEFKGIKELWQAFIELENEMPNEWELWCLGVGDIEPVNHVKIKHFGFVQPKDLNQYTLQTGVFILPSRFEPWGVVAHEYAASGFPLLLSDSVGAKEQFLQEGKNGFSFKSGNVLEIKNALKKIMSTSEEELISMSAVSNALAQAVSPQTWVNALLSIVNK